MRVNPRFFSSPASPARPSKAAADGFSLVELLVASAIGLVLTIGGVAMYFGNLRATTTLVTGQTLRDNWARVNLFINADISEACNAAVVGGALVLTLDPTPADPCGDPGNVTITYSLTGDSLVRTGPPIDDNGVLNLGATAISQALINGVAFDPSCTAALEPCYQLTLSQGTSTYSDTGGAAIEGRARVREY